MSRANGITITQPSDLQLNTIADAIQDELLRDWSSDQITAGIKHIGQTEVGIVTHVYVSRAFFSQLSFRKGLGRWKPFRVGTYMIGMLKGKS